MSDQTPSSSADKPGVRVTEPEAGPVFESYESPAGGWGALRAVAQALICPPRSIRAPIRRRSTRRRLLWSTTRPPSMMMSAPAALYRAR
jgi:hypothetical protein